MAFGIAGQQSPGGVQCAVIAESGEDVGKLAVIFGCITYAIGGKQRQMKRTGDFNGGVVADFLLAVKMALEFDIDVAGTEDVG
jgi:hypothetical protein